MGQDPTSTFLLLKSFKQEICTSNLHFWMCCKKLLLVQIYKFLFRNGDNYLDLEEMRHMSEQVNQNLLSCACVEKYRVCKASRRCLCWVGSCLQGVQMVPVLGRIVSIRRPDGACVG